MQRGKRKIKIEKVGNGWFNVIRGYKNGVCRSALYKTKQSSIWEMSGQDTCEQLQKEIRKGIRDRDK